MKSLINRALLLEQLKRFWVIAALPLLTYLLAIVLPLYRAEDETASVRIIIQLLAMTHPVMLFTSVLMPLVAALGLFSYLFRSQSVTAFSAFPINRKQLFCTNLTAGFILLLLPLLILLFFLLPPIQYHYPNVRSLVGAPAPIYVPPALFPHGVQDGQVINSLPMVLMFIGRTALVFIFYFAVFTLAAVVSGHGVVAALLCVAFPLIPLGVFGLDQAIRMWMVVGYDIDHIIGQLRHVLVYTNALGWLWQYSGVYFNPADTAVPPETPAYFLGAAYTAITAILLAAAYFCHRARKQERTGDSVVFNGLKHVMIFLLAMAGGVIMFVFSVNMFIETPLAYAGSVLGFALGFILAFFIAQMVAEKTFNVGHKIKSLFKYGAVMAALYGLVILYTRLDMDGFQHWVPDAGEVTGVYVDYPMRYAMTQAGSDYWITDTDIIAQTVEAHKNLLPHIDSMRHAVNYRTMGLTRLNGEAIYQQAIYYRLNNGRLVSRMYLLTGPIMETTGWLNLLDDERVILSTFPAVKNPDAISQIDLEIQSNTFGVDAEADAEINWNHTSNFEQRQYPPITDKAQLLSLMEAIKKDMVEYTQTTNHRKVSSPPTGKTETVRSISIRITSAYDPTGQNNTTPTYADSSPHYFSYFIEASANTERWLTENGYEPITAGAAE